MTREEIEALVKLADEATPGPWAAYITGTDEPHSLWLPDQPRQVGSTDFAEIDDSDDAEYLAACSPERIKALCALALKALDQ